MHEANRIPQCLVELFAQPFENGQQPQGHHGTQSIVLVYRSTATQRPDAAFDIYTSWPPPPAANTASGGCVL